MKCSGFRVSRAALVLLFALAACIFVPAAQAYLLECPATAPKEWGLPEGAKLEQPAVLSEKKGQPINESAPPSLMPDRGFARGAVWHNVWLMGDEPGWSHFVDCQYRGSPRILRLPADGLKQCEQTAQPLDAKRGIAPHATQTMVCD
jgi:hypothetical protein